MILRKILSTIRAHALLEPGDSVLVAVSGGADSIALLHLLAELDFSPALRLTVAHLDHRLRGSDGAGDLAFVEQAALRLGLACVTGSEDVAALARREKRSIEEAGRVARRRFLRAAAGRLGARRIALGHHRDDQVESVLLRLISGAGRGGLSGMRPLSEGLFVRPLLDCTREEILGALRERGLAWRSDASNDDLRFPRNRLRHRVIPVLREEFNPRIGEAVARTAELLREEDVYLEALARHAFRRVVLAAGAMTPGPVVMDAARLGRLPTPLARRVVRMALRRAGLAGRDLARARIEEILDLASRGGNREGTPGGGLGVRLEYGRLSIGEAASREGLGPPGRRSPPGSAAESSVDADSRRQPRSDGAESPLDVDPLQLRGDAAESPSDAAHGDPLPVPGVVRVASCCVQVEAQRMPRTASSAPWLIRPEPADLFPPDPGTPPEPSHDAPRLPSSPGPEPADLFPPHPGTPPRPSRDALRLPPGPGPGPGPGVGFDENQACVDAGAVRGPLIVRRARPGDRFRPLNAPGTRKLSDLWTDRKVPKEARRRQLVVEDGSRIVWAIGLGLAHEYRVTASTRELILLNARPLEPPRVLYSAGQISAAISSLAVRISAWADGRELLVLGILNGSFMFVADLIRRLPGPVQVGFLDREGSPVGRSLPLSGRTILLIEDILDTGRSLSRVLERVRASGASEVRTCVLFDKPSGRQIPIEADFRGLEVPDLWVVGYGLDHQGAHRNLPYLTWI